MDIKSGVILALLKYITPLYYMISDRVLAHDIVCYHIVLHCIDYERA